MMERLEDDLVFAGRCYHSLFLGEDTDEAECAARHTAEVHGLIKAFITAPPPKGSP
jgi:ferredoxin-thioredoxin reductase catalytic subunit